MRPPLVAAVMFAGTTLLAQQSVASQAPGTLTGVVVDATTGAPVRFARVTAGPSGGGGPGEGVLTDAAGQFVLTDVAPGRLAIRARHAAYANGMWGRRHEPFGMFQYFDLQPGEQAGGFVIRLTRLAAISGLVSDRSGAPIAGAVVHALRLTYAASGLRYHGERTAVTSNSGAYFFADLVPARYLLAAASPSIPDSKLRSTGDWITRFAPAATSSGDATIVTLAPADRREANIQVASNPTVPIRGRVTGPNHADLELRLLREDDPFQLPLDAARASTAADGRFAFGAVPAGRYRLRALKFPPADLAAEFRGIGFGLRDLSRLAVRPPEGPTMWADIPVVVGDTPIENLDVPLRQGARVTGRVSFEGSATPPSADVLMRMPLIPLPALGSIGDLPIAAVGADGRFATVGLPDGRYSLIGMHLAQLGWWQRMALVDLAGADADIALRFVDRPSRLSGVLRDPSGSPRPDATAYVFPADRALWQAGVWEPTGAFPFIPDRYGRYESIELAPRDYFVIGLGRPEPDFPAPHVLETLMPRAVRVTINGPGTKVLDLTVR